MVTASVNGKSSKRTLVTNEPDGLDRLVQSKQGIMFFKHIERIADALDKLVAMAERAERRREKREEHDGTTDQD